MKGVDLMVNQNPFIRVTVVCASGRTEDGQSEEEQRKRYPNGQQTLIRVGQIMSVMEAGSESSIALYCSDENGVSKKPMYILVSESASEIQKRIERATFGPNERLGWET